ncbi:hypothetical protein NEOLEDRAFT_1097697 [Neolentinus lepideus HHB14362 ss-1]|uniref:Helicase SWR1 n=1 Tax=Neolentinus lepideus HHB14362 ss-1 TaxID=1314782 RepID=A0A165QJG9_9AGAM|nr:hypothetical protein NEOLEDRAFT_1097697 [Neolentinus lepideus HHB14362 ss-1]
MTGTRRHTDIGLGRAVDNATEVRRASLVQERQAELESVLDRHDTLVREAFHLEKFVSLLSFDPRTAKEDKSNVFQEYKAQHDLLDWTSTSRKTRRGQSQRFGLLTGSGSSSASASTSSSPVKKQTGQSKTSARKGNDAVIWDILASAKGKGRAKAKAGSNSNGATLSSPVNAKGKGKGDPESDEEVERVVTVSRRSTKQVTAFDAGSQSSSISHRSKRSAVDVPHVVGDNDGSSSRPRKRRKTEPVLSTSQSQTVADGLVYSSDMPPPPPPTPKRLGKSQKSLGVVASASNETPSRLRPRHSTITVESPKPSLARRVTLIVRKPPPSLSHPQQKPPPAQHGRSLSTLLRSYTMLEQEDVDPASLERMANKDARIWSKYDTLRREGKIVGLDMFGTASEQTAHSISDDPWSEIVSRITTNARRRAPGGQQIAGQVAAKIRAYWEGQSMRDDKVRAQEEKRLRALAKATIRMVVAEWKKAVFHIREQERLRLEEDDRRRGREHLDAILDQSGQILEAQHADLARAESARSGSRSNSVISGSNRGTVAESDEEEGSDTSEPQEEAAAEESGEDAVKDDGADGLDTSALLDPGATPVPPSASETSASQSPSLPQEDVDMALSEITTFVESPFPMIESPSPTEPSLKSPEYILERSPYVERELSKDSGVAFDGHTAQLRDSSYLPPIVESFHSDAAYSNPTALDDASQSSIVQAEDHPPSSHLVRSNNMESNVFPMHGAKRMSDTEDGLAESRLDSIMSTEVDNGPRASLISDWTHTVQADAVIRPTKPMKDDNFRSVSIPVEDAESDRESANENNVDEDSRVPAYLRSFAAAPVDWNPEDRIKPPLLLRGVLRPYQQAGLEWLASLHASHLNGILADEMGLGKTIQTISLLAHLACDRGIWGPHLIIVPTSVILNWEMEFKKFLPGFNVVSYHGTTKRRKELRQGWNNKYHFNVCITSYTLASRDAHIFKRKPWYYMILDEAHMIKNFKSQRWNILLMFRSFRRLLLTGTPLQNNLTELWALLQFLMSGTNFANVREFSEWFANPLEKAIEAGTAMDDETQQRVTKLHTVLRPYLLRRLKRDVEKELPSKFEHIVLCPLSKRQRFLYDEFMSRRQTQDDLQSGVYQKVANILMQLRKVCNHPDLFEVRSIVTSFTMPRSVISDFEIKELLLRRRFLADADEDRLSLDVLGLNFVSQQNTSMIAALETQRLDGTAHLPLITEQPGEPPPRDTRTIAGWNRYREYQQRAAEIARWTHIAYLNRLRCSPTPVYSSELLGRVGSVRQPIVPWSSLGRQTPFPDIPPCLNAGVKSYRDRSEGLAGFVDRFAFVTSTAVALDLPRIALPAAEPALSRISADTEFDAGLHRAAVKLQIAFPDPTLLQYDCGKLQKLAELLKERKAGGHRCLIFTQMTKILDILETFLNLHGYLYLRLDGATKIEDRQYITERFNADDRVFCFISSSRSGGVGINLTGADTVIFYDSDFNPQMDRQCEDRAHRIGQSRDVHIFRFVSAHTVEEALLRKANQKRSLDDLVIQKGEFDWQHLFVEGQDKAGEMVRAMGEFEDIEDRRAADVAAREEVEMTGADEADFGVSTGEGEDGEVPPASVMLATDSGEGVGGDRDGEEEGEEEGEGGTTVDYMLYFVKADYEFFKDWKI